jgi:tetratricopeptide (TPR) repeat protein
MSNNLTFIKQCEDRIENALWSLEVADQLEEAREVYRTIENDLNALSIPPDDIAYSESQRVLAYCLLRQGNLLRQMGQTPQAMELGEREVAAARASGDLLTLARSLMSHGTNLIVASEMEPGMKLIEEARNLFEAGESDQFKQGLGWYWILQADMANAGLSETQPSDVIYAADQALAVLLPIENWPGVARAYAARAQAHQGIGDDAAAAEDRKKQKYYEDRPPPPDSEKI